MLHPFLIACERLGISAECRQIGAVALDRMHDRPPGWWTPYSAACRLALRLNQYQAIVAHGTVGAALAMAAVARPARSTSVIVTSHANIRQNRGPAMWAQAALYKLGLRAAAVTIFMAQAQLAEAVNLFGCPRMKAALLPVGVDTEFFRPKTSGPPPEDVDPDLQRFCQTPYIVVAGDQLRNEHDVIKLAESLGARLVRLTQNAFTEDFWKSYSNSSEPRIPVFCKAHMTWTSVRFAYQQATAMVSLADNSWQPAGWTTILEAMSCGIPVLARRGLVTEELKRYNLSGQLPIATFDSLDESEVTRAFGPLTTGGQADSSRAEQVRSFVARNFAIDGVSRVAVEILERTLKGRKAELTS